MTFDKAVKDAKYFLSAEQYIEGFGKYPDQDRSVPFEEAVEICRRIREFCSIRDDFSNQKAPYRISGHAVIGDCFADLALDSDIVEVKCVDRNFRSTDLRQCLIYNALLYLSSGERKNNIVLLNPLRGIYGSLSVEEIVDGAGGRSFIDFCQDFSYAVSSCDLSL